MFRKLVIVLALLTAAIIGTAGLSRAQPQGPIGWHPSLPQPRIDTSPPWYLNGTYIQLQREFQAEFKYPAPGVPTEFKFGAEMPSGTHDWLAEDSGSPARHAALAVAVAGTAVAGAIIAGAIGGWRARSRRQR